MYTVIHLFFANFIFREALPWINHKTLFCDVSLLNQEIALQYKYMIVYSLKFYFWKLNEPWP